MGKCRIMSSLAVFTIAAASLASSSEGTMAAHQQLQIRDGGFTFKVSRYNGRKTPYRVYFWDKALSGSSYRFDEGGKLVYFKAGSEVYSKVSIDPAGGGIEFSRTTESRGGKNDEDDHYPGTGYAWEDFSCAQCSSLQNVCGSEGSESGGLSEFCHAVNPAALGSDGTASVKILCDHRVHMCAKVATACDSKCDTGERYASTNQLGKASPLNLGSRSSGLWLICTVVIFDVEYRPILRGCSTDFFCPLQAPWAGGNWSESNERTIGELL